MSENRDAIPFAVEISRMIELLASQIYPSPFALLRENVQNAFDAIMIRRHAGQAFEARIEVTVRPDKIEVKDNGVGMSRAELREHFWRAGSSSKNTDEARAAGVVGTFGIGAMANFGIADRLDVVSESSRTGERTECSAERSTLSVTDDCISFKSHEATGEPGTIVTAALQPGKSIDVAAATNYISDFVRFVEIPVLVNGSLVSCRPLDEGVADLQTSWRWEGQRTAIGPQLLADLSISGAVTGEVRVDVKNIILSGNQLPGRMILRQGVGALRTFRNRFGLASASLPSQYSLGGVADFLILQPTAGREALTTQSQEFLNSFAAPIDAIISQRLSERPEVNASQPFINWAAAHGRWELCGLLRARIEPGDSATLKELAVRSESQPILIYSGADPATMGHASSERPVVQLARNHQRRTCEENYLKKFGKVEFLSDEPKVLSRLKRSELSLAQGSFAFRLTEILNSDYFLQAEVSFGKMSHGLPLLVEGENPVLISLDPDAANVAVILEVYKNEFGAFGHMAKDFVRNVIFPRVSHLVPSATRQGAEAFLKNLHRSREIFEYERSDLDSLASLWNDYLAGRINMQEASIRAASVRRSYQDLEPASAGRVQDVVPDVANERQSPSPEGPNLEPLPPIERRDISTDRKVLIVEEFSPPLNGYRCFLAVSKRVYEERGDFFLQPHRTSVVWGGQKALFIFEHQSGEFGLYYDVQMLSGPVAAESGGGAFETSTIVMKNQIFIPVPEPLRMAFLPQATETKRLDIRCDLLSIDAARGR